MAQPESDGSELGGCRLLFAKDNMTAALSLGLCVYKTGRCAESLALIKTQTFDVALLDAHCPTGGLSGRGRAGSRRIPFLFWVGHSGERLSLTWHDQPAPEETTDPARSCNAWPPCIETASFDQIPTS